MSRWPLVRANGEVLRTLTARGFRNRQNRPVAPQTFTALLRNPVHVGRIELPKWKMSKREDWEPLVSEELFSRVQNRRKRAATAKPHVRQHPDFPLRVFVRCGHCDTPLTGSWSRGRNARYAYYSCRKCGRVRAPRARLDNLFLERLRMLQPSSECMRLFNAIVRDVWREQQADARKLREETERSLQSVARRTEQLESAFIFERRIDRETYERQKDKLREESTLLEIRLHETRLEKLDVEGLLAFAEHVLTDAAGMWSGASVAQRAELQRVSSPKDCGLTEKDLETP